jgi:multiple sugar transport system ATP-binding protein
MDEPLSNLDAKLRSQTRAELVELHQRLGTTFVYVTHDQVEAMTMADRIAVLDHGRLRQVGTPREVYDAPADIFVAGFIGTPPMNTNIATIDGSSARVGDSTLSLDHAPACSSAVFGVRPEHLRLDPDGPLRAKVRQAEWLGHEALVRVQPAGVDSTSGWMVRLAYEDAPPEPGSDVRLAVTGPVHLFDPDTGHRLRGEAST